MTDRQAELAEQTKVGAALVPGLVRAQLALAARLALVVAIGWAYLRLAERNEQDFTAVVQRPDR